MGTGPSMAPWFVDGPENRWMGMKRSWLHAARRHPGGWAIALATAALVLAPGLPGTPPAAARSYMLAAHDLRAKDTRGHDARGHGDRHVVPGARHDRPGHKHRDLFTFTGGETVPRADAKASFQVRHEERAKVHGRLQRRHHHMHGGRVLRVSVTNMGRTTWEGPVILVLDHIGGHARLHRPCGFLPTGEPFVCLMRSGTWGPGATTPKAELRFTSGKRVAFTWHVEAMPDPPADLSNHAPAADAGPDQTAFTGATVTLDGSGSTDLDGDALTFAWSVDSAPAGSHAAPSDPTAVNPTFTLDKRGTYVLSLLVDDGLSTSAPDTVQVSTLNSPPVADAGPDRAAFVGDTVTLDGTGSSDVDGDALAFSWSIVAAPAGSAAALSDPEAILPTLHIDRAGTYEVELVVSDATDDSAPATVFVTTLNSAPQADAGAARTVPLGSDVGLSGAGSFDPDGDALSFQWSLTSVPAGSAAVLSDPAAEAPHFTADVAGTYVAQLVVNDGVLDSAAATVVIDTANTRPVADAGLDNAVLAGTPAVLDGTGSSDPDGDPFSFFWAITAAPAGSTAALDDPAAARPRFTPDLAGDYLVQLIVSDGNLDSAPDTALVSAFAPPALFIGDVALSEGNAGTKAFVFTVSRVGTLIGDVAVQFATQPGTASGGIDYQNASGTLTIPAGQASGTITVNVNGDAVMENDETFVVNLSNPVNATLADAQGQGTILNDDTPSVSIGDVTVTEGNSGTSAAVFPVTLSGALSVNVDIQFSTQAGTATAGSDFLATSGILTIRAGRTSGVIAVSIVGDTVPEGTETFQVNLTGAGAVPILDGTGIGTILDND